MITDNHQAIYKNQLIAISPDHQDFVYRQQEFIIISWTSYNEAKSNIDYFPNSLRHSSVS